MDTCSYGWEATPPACRRVLNLDFDMAGSKSSMPAPLEL